METIPAKHERTVATTCSHQVFQSINHVWSKNHKHSSQTTNGLPFYFNNLHSKIKMVFYLCQPTT